MGMTGNKMADPSLTGTQAEKSVEMLNARANNSLHKFVLKLFQFMQANKLEESSRGIKRFNKAIKKIRDSMRPLPAFNMPYDASIIIHNFAARCQDDALKPALKEFKDNCLGIEDKRIEYLRHEAGFRRHTR